MKRLLFFFLGFVGLIVSSLAQISFGVKGGLNVNQTNVNISSIIGTQTSIGFHAGGFAQMSLNKKFSFSPELQYSRRGYKVGSSGYTVNVNYIELPLLFSYSLNKMVGVDLGADPSIEISSNTTLPYNKFDFGAVMGVRAYVTEKIFLTARYYDGFLSILDVQYQAGPNPSQSWDVHEKTRVIQLGAGYKIM